MKSFRLAVAVILLSGATHTSAQTNAGFYVAASYMAIFTEPNQFEVGPKPAKGADLNVLRHGTGTFETGFLGLRAAGGYSIVNVRAEAEVSYRQVALSDPEYESFTTQAGRKLSSAEVTELNKNTELTVGDLKILGLMANLWYDLATGTPLLPYVGVGIGATRITVDATFKVYGRTQEFPEVSIWALAVQGGAGLGYEIIDGLVASLGYRVLGTTEADVSWNQKGTDTDHILRGRTLHHHVELGIRYRF